MQVRPESEADPPVLIPSKLPSAPDPSPLPHPNSAAQMPGGGQVPPGPRDQVIWTRSSSAPPSHSLRRASSTQAVSPLESPRRWGWRVRGCPEDSAGGLLPSDGIAGTRGHSHDHCCCPEELWFIPGLANGEKRNSGELLYFWIQRQHCLAPGFPTSVLCCWCLGPHHEFFVAGGARRHRGFYPPDASRISTPSKS